MISGESVSFDHSSFKMVIGPLTVLPYNNSNGLNPKLDCSTSLYAKSTAGRYLSLGLSEHNFLSIDEQKMKFLDQSIALRMIGCSHELFDSE